MPGRSVPAQKTFLESSNSHDGRCFVIFGPWEPLPGLGTDKRTTQDEVAIPGNGWRPLGVDVITNPDVGGSISEERWASARGGGHGRGARSVRGGT
eukprot:8663063-Pyramimonas_sp.AAC.1